ncbi:MULTISPECIES: PTS IIA-like nitrogen regulatory protein PtsN [Oceanospirillaceae]|jgi:PTS system nitrogen regulatory IIA component|uniref:PTS IIA-like nitrogen regulatory protein PtsN n=1 Tax=Oceanospirillaceae TaxID=135620 RepID=UPI000C6AFA6D|nr:MULTISPECIES: PTS IIA-like nitrogen regulatory protein PtsN [Thalassolituus]PIQ39833.1 MAG: PTS IIA-like nitrogen-regulatory protein PtsN [Thalassolituus sp. CG17_big_fil_post_rev_8_21_14_2_50_53_8]MCA6060024.1 PTS IIA-like nitrogen regulatory protein PtsN [Thalassolituus sp. ST750PaO-4]MCB2388358.1 PTS IIA-like nitrogen regulatory protein PtsN [Thalassolituus alkanivorans]MCB2423924.1 PTS IIA-like nitrogen regulatory protein PtsN [Thalassolituus alkanivorans]TVV39491.1 PTS IIA-like nitroge
MDIRIEDILTPERSLIDAPVSSKKKLLEYLAGFIAEQLSDSSADDIYERLLSRERLGSTGIGEGIAIPHCRLKQCDQAMGVLLRLVEPVDYDAIDRKPVDLVFALLVPEEATEQHLQVLAMLARNFSEPAYREALRKAPDAQRFYQRALSGQPG